MISKTLKYTNGHFYDRETGKRIALRDDIEVNIASDDTNFVSAKPAGNKPNYILNAEEKLNEVASDPKVRLFKKVFDAGKVLYFCILKKDAWFKVELLEDLYLFLNKKTKKKEGNLYSCACVVRENINNKISFFEEVHATSLNELYKSTYVHYFGNFGNPACNALDRFFEDSKNDKSNLKGYRLFIEEEKKK
jgi:uncharacterized pyridoxamine 5'-phosphate oxidase family protein